MQRTLERADGRRDRGVHIGKRSGGDPGREGGSIQLMVGVQNQSNIQRPLGGLGGRDAIQHQ